MPKRQHSRARAAIRREAAGEPAKVHCPLFQVPLEDPGLAAPMPKRYAVIKGLSAQPGVDPT